MVDVAVSAQLEQWAFDNKSPAQHPDSSASSPQLCHAESETLRLDAPTAVDDSTSPESKKALSLDLQDRYLSSEEDLSPMDMSDDEDDVVSIHDGEAEQACCQARKMSVSRFDKGKSCDMAVMVSYVSAGRPKVIDLAALPSPIRDLPQRSASLAQLPMDAINKLKQMDQSSRLSTHLSSSAPSTISRPPSPVSSKPESRRPSTTHAPFSNNSSSLRITDSSSSFTDRSTRSNSPAISEGPARPASVSTQRPPIQPRSSLYISSTSTQTRPFPPLTPISPHAPSFLSSDPYESTTTSAASPILKSSSHKRLRSISQRLSLAKIAITPSTRKWDSRIHGGRANHMPPTPATPYTPTPLTPQTAPIAAPSSSSSSFSPPKGMRRHSRLSRPNSIRGPSPDIPPVPQTARLPPPPPPPPPQRPGMQKLVPRGADEREPILELPPCPDEVEEGRRGGGGGGGAASVKSTRRIRKRKSLMDLL